MVSKSEIRKILKGTCIVYALPIGSVKIDKPGMEILQELDVNEYDRVLRLCLDNLLENGTIEKINLDNPYILDEWRVRTFMEEYERFIETPLGSHQSHTLR